MLKRFRHMHISLAAKCQMLFGAAAMLIIFSALYVPWKRMENLTNEVNFQTARALADQEKFEHIAIETRAHTPLSAQAQTPSADTSGYIWPQIIPANPPATLHLDRFETVALDDFKKDAKLNRFSYVFPQKEGDQYRLAMPLINEGDCLKCHQSSAVPSAGPPTRDLLGIVVVTIPSQVTEAQIYLNRAWILLAGFVAGTLAIGVLYLIVSRLILRPVRVLQETAEKVSRGDLNIRSDISTGDEFQQLSETFNTMLANLKSGDDQLRTINKTLDLKLDQLAQSNVALFESNRLKSEFLANVSHELRTPLNSILGFAELLKETVAEVPDAKPVRYVQNILTAGRNLLDLINDLLDLAKIEAGRMDVRSEPLSLGDIFEGLVGLLKPLAEQKELTMEPQVASDVPIIHTDPAKLQQVLYNFLSNAIKFSPVGGSVSLSAVPHGQDSIRISVADQGPGIPPEKQHEIFEKFRQVDGSVTRQHSGTGLGLAISKELTALLGGAIGVESTPGQGALFWIDLPLKIQPGARDVRANIGL